MTWFQRLSAAISQAPPVDPEVERAERRNRLRALGKKIDEERSEVATKLGREREVYRVMLHRSGGNAQSPAGKEALKAKRNCRELEQELGHLDARLEPVLSVLRALSRKQIDGELHGLLSEVVTAEKLAPDAVSAQDLDTVLRSASDLVNASDAATNEYSRNPTGTVLDIGQEENELAADFAALSTSPVVAPSSQSRKEEEAQMAAVAMLMRQGPAPKAAAYPAVSK